MCNGNCWFQTGIFILSSINLGFLFYVHFLLLKDNCFIDIQTIHHFKITIFYKDHCLFDHALLFLIKYCWEILIESATPSMLIRSSYLQVILPTNQFIHLTTFKLRYRFAKSCWNILLKDWPSIHTSISSALSWVIWPFNISPKGKNYSSFFLPAYPKTEHWYLRADMFWK